MPCGLIPFQVTYQEGTAVIMELPEVQIITDTSQMKHCLMTKWPHYWTEVEVGTYTFSELVQSCTHCTATFCSRSHCKLFLIFRQLHEPVFCALCDHSQTTMIMINNAIIWRYHSPALCGRGSHHNDNWKSVLLQLLLEQTWLAGTLG